MKRIKYLLFSLLCLFCSCLVFAKNEVVIKSITTVYDQDSTVEVSDNGVIFNDKDQSVKYNVVLENTTSNDLIVEDINLSKPSEDFLIYELEGLDKDDILKANSTYEVTVSLSTIKKEGWGRNFNDELIANISFKENIINPNTSTMSILAVLTFVLFITGILVILVKNRKISRYVVLVIMFGSLVSVTSAKESLLLPIKLNVSYESQNVMVSNTADFKISYIQMFECEYHWKYRFSVKNLYFQNEINEIENYVYKIDVSDEQNGKVWAYFVDTKDENDVCYDLNNTSYPCYDLYIQSNGVIYANENARYYFAYMTNLENIYNLENLDTSNVTNMEGMFYLAGFNNKTVDYDLNSLNTSNVISMKGMFFGIGMEIESVSLKIDKLDTSNVTDMNQTFAFLGAGASDVNFDVSNFDTSKVTDMSQMFGSAATNDEDFTLDVSGFDTRNVTTMSGMFASTGRSSKTFMLDVDNFDTSKVTSMYAMFFSVGYSNPNFTLDVSNFDTSKVTDMARMFYETGYSNPNFELDVSKFDTSNVTLMWSMFEDTGYMSTIIQLDVSGFDTSNVTDISAMFKNTGYNNSNFTLDVGGFDTNNVTNMREMFSNTGYKSTKLNTSITIRNNNISYYTNMFKNVATKTGSKITVNYTEGTEDLVDKMIATKSSNSNVVKGVQVD